MSSSSVCVRTHRDPAAVGAEGPVTQVVADGLCTFETEGVQVVDGLFTLETAEGSP